LLLHICCAPCTIYPYRILREKGASILGLYFNPNIHPYTEFAKRRDTLKQYADSCGLDVFFPNDYPMEEFLKGVVSLEEDRCSFCYHQRLKYAAVFAKTNNMDAFSTTLLYSIYQKHDLIRQIAEGLASEHGVPFYYEDFRKGWKEGIEISRESGLYRQKYCGCIFSEKERFAKKDSQRVSHS
jgi:epoxyqueuosine reductase